MSVASRPPPDKPPGGRLFWLLGLAAVALVVRIGYVLVVLPGYVPVSDAHHYHTLAVAVAEGRGLVHPYPFGFDHPTAFRPPLYPLLLGGVYALAGVRLGAAQVLNVALGTIVVAQVAAVAWTLAGRRAAVSSGLLAAVFSPLVANDGVPLSEPLCLSLLLTTLLLLLGGRTTVAGISTGLMMLTRPSAQLLVVALGGWIAWRWGWRRALGYVAVAGIVVAPWIGRNLVALGSPVLVTSNGFNLAATYSPEALAAGGFVDPVFDPRFAPVRDAIANEVALDSALRDYAVASLRERPLAVLAVAVRNTLRLGEVDADYNVGAETLDGRDLTLRATTLPLVRLVIVAGALALWRLRRRPGAGPLLLSTAVLTFASLLSVPAPRLRAPFDVAVCVALGALLGARQPASATGEGVPPPPLAAGHPPPAPARPQRSPGMPVIHRPRE